MNMYNEISSKLKEGQKITVICFNDFGFIGMTQTTFEKVEKKEHYLNCPESMIGVKLIHKPKGKRKFYGKTIDYSNSVLIYDGWIDINIDVITNNITNNEGIIIKESKYSCFDKQYFEDIQDVIAFQPIVKINC